MNNGRITRPRRALLSRIAMVLCVLLISACSSTTFVYNRLDFFLPWYLDDYVDLTRAQDKSLDLWLEPFLKWHRVDELPQYVQILNDIDAALDQELTPEDVGSIFSEFELAWLRLEQASLGWIFKLGDSLSDEQVDEFLSVLHQEQEDYEKEYLERSDKDVVDESYENFLDTLQDYLGRLSKSQQASLREASAELGRVDGLWLQERAVWLEALGKLLQREPAWQQGLRGAIDVREANQSPAYSNMLNHNMDVVERIVASVLNNRTEKQDRRLRRKIKNLKEDLETLIQQ